jgi:hypothetical protein
MSEDVNNVDLMRQFRSRLNSLPLEFKCEIGEVPLQKGMRATSRKEKVIELLNKYNIDFNEVGTGTNRFIVKYKGYALKIALDREGIADNMQEFAICESLMPYVAYAYEISSGGHLLVADYCPAFTTQNEQWQHNGAIRSILTEWSKRFLLGDVGITERTYANWGLRGGNPVCIDYAYIFPSAIDQFECICGNKSMAFTGSDFSAYKCTKCGKVYEDRELRTRISSEERIRLFNGVHGVNLSQEYEMHPVDPIYAKIDDNPDLPDLYETASVVTDHMHGLPTPGWL